MYDSRAPEGVRVEERAAPRRKAGSVLVRVVAAGLNPVDAKRQVGDKLPEALDCVSRAVVAGRCVGFDFAGVVHQAPAGAGLSPGDAVFGSVPPLTGSCATFVSAPLHQVARKPESLSFREAATLVLPGLTAVQAFEQHSLQAGQRLLVVGATGGVGHLAVQIGKRSARHRSL